MDDKILPEMQKEWDPFETPLFKDASVRHLKRVGVIDIGSNTVRLVIFDGAARSPAYFYNEKVMCALGEQLSETQHLNTDNRARAFQAICRFVTIARSMQVTSLIAVATAAVREANDGPEFCQQIEAATNLKIWVVDGGEEARLSAQGVLLGWPDACGLMCDIGGASMELAQIDQGVIGRCATSPLGPLKMRDIKGGKADRVKVISDQMADLCKQMGGAAQRLFLVGGCWRAIAMIDMYRRSYPLKVLHEYTITPKDIYETIAYIETCDLEHLRRVCAISGSRMDLIPYACEVLAHLIKAFCPKDIVISIYGLREGILYEQMPDKLRRRDPLIEASRFAEDKDARLPGFGKSLYQFIIPLFADAPDSQKRLIKAACLLHDVSWRAHPDYRAEICFDTATRANLGGLSHSERVFLGLALLHRYRNRRGVSHFDRLFDLLSIDHQCQAEVLGKAMRLGAMLWINTEEQLIHMRWSGEQKTLNLVLKPQAVPLFGEVAKARFASLVKALGASCDIIYE